MKAAISILILIFCTQALAEDFVVPGLTDEPEETKSVTFEEAFIQSDIYVSEWFNSVADGLDIFLAGKRLTKRKNETHVRLENSTFYVEGQGLKNAVAVNVNLRLPNVEEFAQLKFTSYDDSNERGVQTTYLRQQPRERNYGATVGLFKKLGNIRTAFQPRIGLQDPLDISHSLTFSSEADLKTYRVNPKLEFFADAKKGTGIFQSINFHTGLTKIYSLTIINEFEYDDRPHLFTGNNGASIGQMITPRSAFSYGAIFTSNNKTEYHLEGYSFSIAWSHVLYKNILDYQIVPHIDFNKEKSFTGVTGIVLNINLNF